MARVYKDGVLTLYPVAHQEYPLHGYETWYLRANIKIKPIEASYSRQNLATDRVIIPEFRDVAVDDLVWFGRRNEIQMNFNRQDRKLWRVSSIYHGPARQVYRLHINRETSSRFYAIEDEQHRNETTLELVAVHPDEVPVEFVDLVRVPAPLSIDTE